MKVKSSEEIKAFCEKYAEGLGLTVPKVEFRQGKNPALTIYIDRTGGVDLDACEAFHRTIDEPLDELDPTFGEAYTEYKKRVFRYLGRRRGGKND